MALIVIVALTTVLLTRSSDRSGHDSEGSSAASSRDSAVHEVDFGAQDSVVANVTVPAGSKRASLVTFDAQIDPMPTSSSRAALFSLRVGCRDAQGTVTMKSTGIVSQNIFLSRGGHLSGQALAPATDKELQCSLLASAPSVDTTSDGLSSLPVRADLARDTGGGTHRLALHRLDDATLVPSGTNESVLSLRIPDATTLDRMDTTVRLTSCTVVGGSRDGGGNRCEASMTGREASTIRMRVIARWLDSDGRVVGTTTYWDETLAVDYNTHHLPWTLRQADLQDKVPDSAEGAVLVVQAQSVAGTPFVVHADGTDSVVTTRP